MTTIKRRYALSVVLTMGLFVTEWDVHAQDALTPKGSSIQKEARDVTQTGQSGDPSKRSALLTGEWRCTLNQEMMKVESTEIFFPDGSAKSQGRIKFQWANELKVEVGLTAESRWRLSGGQLCDVPRTMTFKAVSEPDNQSIKTLISAMQMQADKRAQGNIETCRQVKTLTASELVLVVSSKTGSAETVCKPIKGRD